MLIPVLFYPLFILIYRSSFFAGVSKKVVVVVVLPGGRHGSCSQMEMKKDLAVKDSKIHESGVFVSRGVGKENWFLS